MTPRPSLLPSHNLMLALEDSLHQFSGHGHIFFSAAYPIKVLILLKTSETNPGGQSLRSE